MHEYRQLPLEGFGQITTLKETLLPYTREFENDDESYTLTPENFLDALENRIQFVDFYVTSLHTARIFALPKCRDHLGRVKVDLAINPDGSLER